MGIFDFFKRKPPPAAAPANERVRNVDPREVLLREAEAVLRSDPKNGKVSRLENQFGLAVERNGDTRQVYLNNLFAETRELPPEERRNRILFFLTSISEDHDEGWDEVQSMLRLVLRPCTANALIAPDGQLDVPMARPAMPFLNALVVVDRPTSMAYVSQKLAEGWEVTPEEVFAAASKNLGAFEGELEVYDRRHGPLFTLPGTDDYAASRLLVPGWLASFQGKVEGRRPLAIVPERSTLFVGGDANPELVKWLAETAQREFDAANRSISPAVYTVDDAGQVVPYQRTDALGPLLRRGHAILAAREYSEQKAVLDAFHEKHDLDLFVATATLMMMKDGRPFSYCVWPDGIEALLPRTDMVVVMGGEPNTPGAWSHMLPFERAREIGGALWTQGEVRFGPERFRVSGSFSPEQRAAFEKAAAAPESLP